MYCSRCGTNNREGSKFCNNCGAQLTPPDVTCPACGTVNPFKNAFCNNCGARLMPPAAARPEPKPTAPPVKGLSLPTKPPLPPPVEPPAAGGDGAREKDAEEEGTPLSGAPETGGPQEAAGDREAGHPIGEELPDWLAQLRTISPVEEEATDETPVSEDMPSWIRQLQSIRPDEPAPEPTPSAEEALTLPTEPKAPVSGDMPSWVRQLQSIRPDEPSLPSEPKAPVSRDTPTWIRQLQPTEPEEPAPEPVPSVEEAPTGRPEPKPPVSEDMPSWVRQLQSIRPDEPAPEPAPSAEEAPTLPVEPGAPTALPVWLEQPDESAWLPEQQTTPPAAQVSEEQPAAVEEPSVAPIFSAAEELPQPPPAEIGATLPTEERSAAETAQVGRVDQSGLPDWLQDLHPEEAAAPKAPVEVQAPATEPSAPAASGLPDWLLAGTTGELQPDLSELPEWLRMAMPAERPQETLAEEALAEPSTPPVLGTPDLGAVPEPVEPRAPIAVADLEVEPLDAGTPLAGLRGVLPLAVAVAEPHMSVEKSAPSIAAEKDDGARIFEAILTEAPAEAEPLSARPAARAMTMRPVIYLLLACAVILPFFFPRNVAQSLLRISKTPAADLYDLIQTLPSDSTVLVAFDYDPSVAGEMNLPANAIVRHLMQRRIKIIAVSTYETGPQIAQKVLSDAAKDAKDYGYGSEYVNAGYIAGHEVGLASLAVGGLPATKDLSGVDVRQYPMAQKIRSANDVALIVELAGSEDTLRWWMEQVQPRTPTRIVAAVSAAVEPQARVYLRPAQLTALVSGLIGAAQYEILSNQPGQALTSVNAQSAAQIVLILIILLGNIAHWISRTGNRASPRVRPEKAA